MNKAKRNYVVDILIGIAFLIAGLTALVFLVPTTWIDFASSVTPTFLGLNFGIWQGLHKWGGIAMMVGVLLHLVLHWKWIINMTKNILPGSKAKQAEQSQMEES